VVVSDLPYGPNTAAIRRFLVRLAGLGAADRAAIVAAHASQQHTRAWYAAEAALATCIERSGRAPQRDALSGPLLQLVRVAPGGSQNTETTSDEEMLATLDPVAEAALAALLALLVRDLLSVDQCTTLYAPFASTIPLRDLG
jgi:hypothetical protein